MNISDLLWGKAGSNMRGELEWAPLRTHLLDTGHVAKQLAQHWIPRSLLNTLASQSKISVGELESLIGFVASIHDIGKATPAFQAKPLRESTKSHLKSRLLLSRFVGSSLELSPGECSQLPHNISGHVIVRRWLLSNFGWSRDAANSFGIVVSGHHGLTPVSGSLGSVEDKPHLLGEGVWQKMQEQLLADCSEASEVAGILEQEILLSPSAQVFISGLVVVADWIASDTRYFRLIKDGAAVNRDLDHEARANAALTEIQLPNPWAPKSTDETLDERLIRGFDLPNGATANSTQTALDAVVGLLETAELVILEAPTGSGKTEAALLAAHKVASNLKLAGITFALPTQATTNAMYSRIFDWLIKLTEYGETGIGDIQLIHGKSDLNEAFQSVLFSDELFDVHDDHEEGTGQATTQNGLVRNQWSSRSKLRLLSNVTVCTIDQILLASLKSRHNVLKHLGLARKVLIIDEVHAADTYMRQYLLRTLEWAGATGVPVICLSATLPSTTRQDLLDAFQQGKRLPKKLSRAERAKQRAKADESHGLVSEEAKRQPKYPLISFTNGEATETREFEFLEDPREVELRISNLGIDELCKKIEHETDQGGRVLVIRNTVRSAIETFDALDRVFPGEVTLSHSRFIGAHRVINDATLLEKFGKSTTEVSSPRQIIVSTQVAEQSLDIDCDVLFTDLAPMDVLLQRIGRLHRHGSRIRPDNFTRARCYVLGFEGTLETEPVILGGSDRIYDRYLLLRTGREILKLADFDSKIQIPNDVSGLIERTYVSEIPVAAVWEVPMSEAQDTFKRMEVSRKERARQNCVGAPSDGEVIWGFSDGPLDRAAEERVAAQVRDAQESIEVILLSRSGTSLNLMHPALGINSALDQDYLPDKAQIDWLRRSTIRIPGYVLPGDSLGEFPQQLENLWMREWQVSPELKDELFLTVDPELGTRLGKFLLTYDPQRGLEITT